MSIIDDLFSLYGSNDENGRSHEQHHRDVRRAIKQAHSSVDKFLEHPTHDSRFVTALAHLDGAIVECLGLRCTFGLAVSGQLCGLREGVEAVWVERDKLVACSLCLPTLAAIAQYLEADESYDEPK